MKYLNLTQRFNPYNASGPECIRFKAFDFNGGEPHIKLNVMDGNDVNLIVISQRINSFQDLGLLMCAVDAIRRSSDPLYMPNIQLFLPYFPGARQDRAMVPGEPLTAKIYADIINSLGFTSVTTFDNHSDVSTALIDNCNNLNNYEFVNKVLLNEDMYSEPCEINIISPDSGANKKVKDLVKKLSIWNPLNDFNIIKCDKTRNTRTGEITGFEVYKEDLYNEPCFIVDDICDGGGTFIGLAKELKKKNAGDIYLVVSHGIFSKPLKELKPYFKKIYTTDSWRSKFSWEQVERDATDLVEIVEFKDFM